jgi:acyl-coenzyme A synthetase/AMP-(fatty) acid ligase
MVSVKGFPMTPSGKIQKFVLRDGIANGTYRAETA